MSNPTDTNQASEDEQIDDVLTNAIDYYISGNGVQPEAISRVKSLIRTEKLKLLAEVREQAQSMPIHGGTDSYSPSKYVQAVSIDALTKLEAEL